MAGGRVGEEVEVLPPQRQIEAELVSDPGNELRRGPAAEHRDGWIARDQAHEQEYDDADADQHRHRLSHAEGGVAHHAAPTPPSMVSAVPVTKRASSAAR